MQDTEGARGTRFASSAENVEESRHRADVQHSTSRYAGIHDDVQISCVLSGALARGTAFSLGKVHRRERGRECSAAGVNQAGKRRKADETFLSTAACARFADAST